jgi:hypothetical protein
MPSRQGAACYRPQVPTSSFACVLRPEPTPHPPLVQSTLFPPSAQPHELLHMDSLAPSILRPISASASTTPPQGTPTSTSTLASTIRPAPHRRAPLPDRRCHRKPLFGEPSLPQTPQTDFLRCRPPLATLFGCPCRQGSPDAAGRHSPERHGRAPQLREWAASPG